MEPQIRYAKTTDGLNIAYFTIGEGVPFVRLPAAPFDHARLHHATWGRRWCDAIGSRMRLIRYDGRGTGMSTRDVLEFTLDTFIEDLRSVVDALELDRFVLTADGAMAAPALAFTARHPDRVSHLILNSGVARVAELWARRSQSTHAMLTNAPDIYVRAVAEMVFGTGTEAATEYAAFMLQCADVRVSRRMLDAQYRLDVTDLLADVRIPTLITCLADDPIHNGEPITNLAATVSATLSVVSAPAGSLSDWDLSDLPATMSFLVEHGVIADAADMADAHTTTRTSTVSGSLRTILFTDIVGHTEMMQRLGDAKGRDVLREHERITRETLKQHGGAEVKTMGDGFMASFGSVTSAMECAIALQRAFAAHTESMPEALHVRVGLNAGEPIEEDGDLFGATVILASRIAAKAGAGEILVPDTVRGLLSGKGFMFGDRGEFVPKGFDEGVRLWDVRWRA